MSVAKPQACEFCEFAYRGREGLECRRFPPTRPPSGPPAKLWKFPVVWPDAWCGEWKPSR
jgi:hypothetical protein